MKNFFILIFILFIISCKPDIKSQKPVNTNFEKFNNNIGKNQLENETILIEEIIKNETQKNEFKKYISGFWVSKGFNEQEINKFGDEIFYTYEVSDIKNNKIYSFNEIGNKKIYLEKQTEIRGIEIGLKNMTEKEEATFYLPSFFAYGSTGDQKKILENFPIKIKLRIIKINKSKQ